MKNVDWKTLLKDLFNDALYGLSICFISIFGIVWLASGCGLLFVEVLISDYSEDKLGLWALYASFVIIIFDIIILIVWLREVFNKHIQRYKK